MGHQSFRRLVERIGGHRLVRRISRDLPDHSEPGDREEGGERPGGVRAEAADQVQVGAQIGEGRGDGWTDHEAREESEADAASCERIRRDAEREEFRISAEESSAGLLAATGYERGSPGRAVVVIPGTDHGGD